MVADEAAKSAGSELWTRQSEQQVQRWLRDRRILPSHARQTLAPALQALDFPEQEWVATLDEMGTDGVRALIKSVQDQQEEEAKEAAAAAEADVQMELQIEMPTDPIELEALQLQIRTDMAAALGVDVSQVGEIELSAPD
jgi:transcriptional regulator with XRE-family HTH domain|eukprot:COSAG02_NODE_2153_length_9654_cov_6.361905_8_plen_140_part_00